MIRPWMPLYVGDYMADTAHLTAAESGAYLHLIMHYWMKGGLPTDDRLLARIARLSPDEWGQSRDVIQAFFQDGWKHKRIEFELTEAARISTAGRNGGIASGVARRAKKEIQSNDWETAVEQSLNETERPLNETGNDSPTICEALQSQSPIYQKGSSSDSSSEGSRGSVVARARSTSCASRLPNDWKISEADFAFAMTVLQHQQIPIEVEKFRDHWRAANGPPSVKRDWSAAWRNWCRKAVEFSDKRNGFRPEKDHGTPRGRSPIMAAIDKHIEQFDEER